MERSQSPDPLQGFRAKLERAREHLGVLQGSVNEFFVENETYTVTRERDLKPGVYVFKVQITGSPPLIRWSLLIGDCIHNIRSALDHLFWAILLVRHPNGVKDAKALFPLLREPSTFKGRKTNLEAWVGPEVTAILESLQPYNAPDPNKHAMMFVHERDIRDKHKLLIPVLWASPKGTLEIERSDNAKSTSTHMSRRTEGDAIFLTFAVEPHDTVVDVKLEPTVGIAFGTDGGESPSVVASLNEFLKIVEGVGHVLGPFAYATHRAAP